MSASGDANKIHAVLENYQTADIPERLKATLAFLEKATLSPSTLAPEDVAPARAAGVSDAALEEAIYVAFMFGIMDRCADVFEFELPDERRLKWTARMLLRLGYGGASVPG